MTEQHSIFNSGKFSFTIVSQNEVYLGNKDSPQAGSAFSDKTYAVGRITVPASVEGYTVIGLSELCFFRCYRLEYICLPNTVSYIENRAICDLFIKKLCIPASVITIGNQMDYFWNCTSFVFEEGSRLQTIGGYFLRHSPNIKSIVFPPFLKSIGPYSMESTNDLESIYFCGEQSF